MRLLPRVFILAAIFMLLIGYQNFTSIDSEQWDSARSIEIINEMNAFREADLNKKAPLAEPQSGSDLQSITNDWAQRQGQILLNGYDKKLEASLNETLNSWVEDLSSDEDSEKTASTSAPSTNKDSESSHKSKQNLRFASLNTLKYDFSTNTCLDLTADPGNTRLNLSRSLNQNAKFGIEHRTANSQTQMFLKYDY